MTELYYSPYRIGSPSFYLLLDRALIQLNKHPDLEIIFLQCKGEIQYCNSNLNGSKLICAKCRLISTSLVKRFKHSRLHIYYLKDFVEKSALTFPNFPNLSSLPELKKIEYKKVNIGLGIASSFVSAYRNLSPSFNHTQKDYFQNLVNTSVYVYEAVLHTIKKYNPQNIVLFNGRFSDLRVVLELSKKHNIPFKTIEFEYIKDPLKIYSTEFSNMLPHNINEHTSRIEQLWKSTNVDARVRISEEFFVRKRNGYFTNDQAFIRPKKIKQGIHKWLNPRKKNYVIFNSSEDENIALGGEYDTGNLFNQQINGVKWICEFLKTSKHVHIVLRIHPNLSNLNFKYTRDLEEGLSDYPNLTVIKADSEISSYSLMDIADKVIVFNSTIGVEACFWGKPVISLDTTLYDHLNVTYIPENLNQLSDLLTRDKLTPKSKLGSLKYGLYHNHIKGRRNVYVDFNFIEKQFLNIRIKFIIELLNLNSLKKILIGSLSLLIFFRKKIRGANKELLEDI